MRLVFLIVFFLSFSASAQELFPHTEPASTIPKNVLGLRYSLEAFDSKNGMISIWNGLKIMYGLTPKLTVIGSVSISNHHTKKFPSPYFNNFQYHHSPASYNNPSSKSFNSFLVEGVALYGKYRFLSSDGEHSHFRAAFYGEFSKSFISNRGAEPILTGNNSGAGAGIILTKLHNKLAISGTAGYLHPFKYQEKDSALSFQSGKGFTYNLSFGYLLYPEKYKSYKDLNVNLYVEFINKIFEKASYVHHGLQVNVEHYPTLRAGQYSEIRPAIQFIINSNIRIDFSVSLPIYQRIPTRMYPVYMINIQRYFYKS